MHDEHGGYGTAGRCHPAVPPRDRPYLQRETLCPKSAHDQLDVRKPAHRTRRLDQCSLLVASQQLKVTTLEPRHGLEAFARLKGIAEHRLRNGEAETEIVPSLQHGGDVLVILGLDQ